jgi:predicted kinase
MTAGIGRLQQGRPNVGSRRLALKAKVGEDAPMAIPAPILIVSGPPGAGKTTVARILAETSPTPAVHLHTDDFYSAIRSGFIAPWLPESAEQNATISRAIAAAVCAYASGGFAVYVDGVVGPWFLDLYREAAAQAGVPLHYLVLRAARETVVARARDRDTAPIADYPPRIFEAFADLGALEPHVLDTTRLSVDAVVQAARTGVEAGRFRLG